MRHPMLVALLTVPWLRDACGQRPTLAARPWWQRHRRSDLSFRSPADVVERGARGSCPRGPLPVDQPSGDTPSGFNHKVNP